MFAITATHTIQPAHIARYQELMRELAAQSRQEPGCLAYHLLQDGDDPRVHLLMEQWQDEEALQLHSETPYFQNIVPQLAALFDTPEAAARWQVIA